MRTHLHHIVPPHAADDASKIASLVAAYEAGEPVTPIVVLDFGSAAHALSGGHRLAALRQLHQVAFVVDEADERLLLVDGQDVYQAALDAGDKETTRRLDQLQAGERGDFGELIGMLRPYLPEEAVEAIVGLTI